jgi:hypothetical protein
VTGDFKNSYSTISGKGGKKLSKAMEDLTVYKQTGLY